MGVRKKAGAPIRLQRPGAALKHILNENERIHQEIASVDLALDTLKELSTTIRDSFGLYLNKTASDLERRNYGRNLFQHQHR